MNPLSDAQDTLSSHNKRYFNDKLILAGLFVLEWLLFKTYFIREISWGYPVAFDQTVYLSRYYRDTLELLNEGIVKFLIKPWIGGYSGVATGILLPYEAALTSIIFGTSRLNALFVNFINYVFLQSLFYVSIKRISKGDSVFSLLSLGLLLALGTPFLFAGGIFDFRLDFLVFCLFGSFVAAVVISNGFEIRKWSVFSGVLGGLLILSRFNTVIYMALVYFVFLSSIIFVFLCKKQKSQSLHLETTRIKNAILSGSTIFVISSLPFFFSMKAIIRYYSALNAEHGYSIWSVERGVSSIYENIIYYLTIFYDQIKVSLWLAAFLFLSVMIIALVQKAKYAANRIFSHLKTDFVFLFISFAIPLLILFSVKSSNQCVISIVNIPFLFLILFPLLISYSVIHGKTRNFFKIIFIAVFVLSILVQVNAYSKRGFHANNTSDTLQILNLYKKIGDLCQLYDIKSPEILVDSVRHYFTPGILEGLFYEKYHFLLEVRMLLASDIFLDDKRVALKQVDASDFAILTHESLPDELIYPVVKMINSIRDDLNGLVQKTMIRVDSRVIEGRDVDLFVKPQLKIRGLNGGWITSDGILIEVLPNPTKAGGALFLSGSYNPDWLPKEKLSGSAEIVNQEGKQEPLKSKLTVEGNTYAIKIFLPEKEGSLGREAPLRIKLSFSDYFVPSELGINDDNRKLVLSAPTDKKYLRHGFMPD